MARLTVRALGMSYLIEGLGPSGLDAEALFHALERAYGPALGRMAAAAGPAPLDALILDRNADTWPALLERLAGWIRMQGHGQVSCVAKVDDSRATLTF